MTLFHADPRIEATVHRAPHLRVFDGLRRVWCHEESSGIGPNGGCRSSFWVPLLSNETLCPTCRWHKDGAPR